MRETHANLKREPRPINWEMHKFNSVKEIKQSKVAEDNLMSSLVCSYEGRRERTTKSHKGNVKSWCFLSPRMRENDYSRLRRKVKSEAKASRENKTSVKSEAKLKDEKLKSNPPFQSPAIFYLYLIVFLLHCAEASRENKTSVKWSKRACVPLFKYVLSSPLFNFFSNDC